MVIDESETADVFAVYATQCCHCCFFRLIWVFFVLSRVLEFLLKICFFFTVVRFYKCMLYCYILHSRKD